GLRDTFAHQVGSQAHLLSVHGITEDQIHAQALELVSRDASGQPSAGASDEDSDGLRVAA
ncbi:MAG: hypothetical protein WAN22_02115, partial [Solirubrobacteraceae bacterium]